MPTPVPRPPLTAGELSTVLPGVTAAERLRGGTKKGVYRLPGGRIAYVWSAAEDYWPSTDDDPLFGHATGLGLFLDAHRALTAAGVPVPAVHEVHPGTPLGDVAVVTDASGGTLEALIDRNPAAAAPALERLAGALRALRADRRDRPGRPGAPVTVDVPRHIAARARGHLAEAARRVVRIAAVAPRLADELTARLAEVRPRDGYSLVHGELGPDHVMLGADGEPLLIDIENTMYLDAEWEHAFAELRFGPAYGVLAPADLDPARLRLYRLAMYLSLVEGPLRLLDGDFPHRSGMLAIAADNVERTLREIA